MPSLTKFFSLISQSRFRKIGMGKKRDPGTTGLSIVCLNPSEIPVNQDQEVYSQLVEVTDPHEWTEVCKQYL